MLTVLIALLSFVVTLYLIKSSIKPKNYPPGPRWYPLVGSSKLVTHLTKVHGSQGKAMSKIAEEYSTNVLGLKLGTDPVIVVYGEKNIKQIFMDKEFEGRPDSFFIRLRCLGKRMGITFTDGPLWREHRQFTLKHLKNVGFVKSDMEIEIQSELENIISLIHKSNEPISPTNFLASSVMNILWKYVAGEKIKEDRLKFIINLFSARSKAFSITGGWINQAPWLRFLLPKLSGYELIKNLNQQLSATIEEAISKHENKLVEGNDFIYSFLEEMERCNDDRYTKEHLKTICLDLLIAGSQTTSNVVEFALLTVLREQTIQQIIYEEIKSVIGDKPPCWSDSHRMVYTAAFLLEVQRFYTIVPLAGPRRVLNDVKIDGYDIPKGSTILIALGDLHMDPALWDKPCEFRPERFINEDGCLIQPENLYPFGLGRRRCPGDSLAKSFIFIIFVGLLQQFRLLPSNGILPSGIPNIGLLTSPKPYTAQFVTRT